MRRWYCPVAHETFSLLPDFAAARLSDTLEGIESAVLQFDDERRSGATVYEAAQRLRPDIELQGALRWTRRRLRWVHAALTLLMGCTAERLVQVELKIRAIRRVLGCQHVLLEVRTLAAPQLRYAPTPVGLAPPNPVRKSAGHRVQHKAGPDPPSRAEPS